jgi:hypothetical protein
MALTVAQLRERLRGIFGDAEDSNRQVENLVANMQGLHVAYKNNEANATATAFVAQAVYTAINKCRLVSARYVQSISSTVSLTDHYILSILKYKSPSWSVTTLMAYLKGSTDAAVTGSMTKNLPRASNKFTLSSLSAEFEMAAGDVLVADVFRNGATGVGQALPQGVLILEIG